MQENQTIAGGRRPNYLYTLISVALVLFLLGFFGLILLQANRFTKNLKEQVELIVELTDDITPADRDTLLAQLRRAAYTKPGSVDFISREEAFNELGDEMGEDILRLDLPNPLYDVITFNVRAEFLDPLRLDTLRSQLRLTAGVSDIYYQENLVERIAANVRRVGWVSLGVAIFFVLVAIVMIHNTIRLALHANRFTIKTQELVGATWSFISRPYLRRAALHGLLSGMLAVVALLLIQLWLHANAPELRLFDDPILIIAFLLALPVLGVLINWLSTYYVVRKYLQLRVDDLY